MMDKADNPMGTQGFEFVEFASPDPQALGKLFERMGFRAVARHRSKRIDLYRQGSVNFVLNAEPGSFAQSFADRHGPSICAIAFRVDDAAKAYSRAVSLGAWGVPGGAGPMELSIPAIKGVGDSLLYLVDRWHGKGGARMGEIGDISIYDVDFVPLRDGSGRAVNQEVAGFGIDRVDHLTHNVHRGRMEEMADFYGRIFNFQEIRRFDIQGAAGTGLASKVLASPCGLIRLPINESSDSRGQVAEFIEQYHGEGVQHVALAAHDIEETVEALRRAGLPFQGTPDAYYAMLGSRLPGHGHDVEALRALGILMDGSVGSDGSKNLLLQIFTKEVVGPIFFELIQRKGNQGFGEGNFKALFDSIERDQIRRGVLPPAA